VSLQGLENDEQTLAAEYPSGGIQTRSPGKNFSSNPSIYMAGATKHINLMTIQFSDKYLYNFFPGTDADNIKFERYIFKDAHCGHVCVV
jgi:hypothetical protein